MPADSADPANEPAPFPVWLRRELRLAAGGIEPAGDALPLILERASRTGPPSTDKSLESSQHGHMEHSALPERRNMRSRRIRRALKFWSHVPSRRVH